MFSFLYHCRDFYRTWLYIWVTRRVSYEKQELPTLRKHLSSSPGFFVGSVLLIFLVFCVVLLCVFTFWVPCCDVRFRIKNYVRFVFTSSCLYDGSCLIYVLCVCLRIVVSNTYCLVFLFWFSSSCVPYVVSFSGLSFFDCHLGIL